MAISNLSSIGERGGLRSKIDACDLQLVPRLGFERVRQRARQSTDATVARVNEFGIVAERFAREAERAFKDVLK